MGALPAMHAHSGWAKRMSRFQQNARAQWLKRHWNRSVREQTWSGTNVGWKVNLRRRSEWKSVTDFKCLYSEERGPCTARPLFRTQCQATLRSPHSMSVVF